MVESTNEAVKAAPSSRRSTGFGPGLLGKLEEMREVLHTPGVSIDVFTNGRSSQAKLGTLAAEDDRPVTPSARFATSCLVKLLVATEILSLAERQKISLDAPVGEYLPELRGGDKKGNLVQIRHLMSHTGGYRGFDLKELLAKTHESWQNCVDMFNSTPLLFEPGTVFSEENLDHILLGEIVSRMHGKPILDVIRDEILASMDVVPGDRMTDLDDPDIYTFSHTFDREKKAWGTTEDNYHPPDATSGTASGLSMTGSDLMRIGKALLDDRRSDRMSAFVRERLFTMAIRFPRQFGIMRNTWYVGGFSLGLAHFRGGNWGYFTTGRGQLSSITFDSDRKSMIALALNVPDGGARERFLGLLHSNLFGHQPDVEEQPLTFSSFVGPYSPEHLAGSYIGFAPEPVIVTAEPRGFRIIVRGKEHYHFAPGPDDGIIADTKAATPVGIFPDPRTGLPCLMLGMHTFRKTGWH